MTKSVNNHHLSYIHSSGTVSVGHPPATMTPQAKILVPFIGQSSTALHNRLMLMVGVVISVFLAGILVTLGISSLMLFRVSSKREGLSKQGYFLVGYTAILIILVVAFEVLLFIVCNAPFIFSPLARELEITRGLLTAATVTLAVMWGVTDGLLVSAAASLFSVDQPNYCFQGLEVF